jgi:membrane protein DedA with SNARE-associated domain
VTGFLDGLLTAPGWVVLSLVGVTVFAEDALFVGFVIPGETAAFIGGVAASRGTWPSRQSLGVVLAAAVIGDSVGYEVGPHLGTPSFAGRRWRSVGGRTASIRRI